MQHLLKKAFTLIIVCCYFGAISSGSTVFPNAIPDQRVREYIMPSRIVWHTETPNMVIGPESLLIKRSGQATLKAHSPCILKTMNSPTGILLDFGKELHGGVQLIAWNSKNIHPEEGKTVRLRVRFGESVSEAMSDIGGATNATNDHAVRDQTILMPWLGSCEIGNTGFRFVRVDLLDPNSFIQFKSIRAVFLYRPLEYQGSFECNEPRLNTIWKTGAYTVHLNMQDYLWDGIKRDRLVWIGDMHPETMTILSVFGQQDIIPASLDLIRDETPSGEWMNGISSYSMWWILIHHEWYRYTGDRNYLKQQRDYLIPLLKRLTMYIDDNNAEILPAGRFLDWPSRGHTKTKQVVHAGLQGLMRLTLLAGEELCKVLNEAETGRLCRVAAERLAEHHPDPDNSKQAAALLALADIEDAHIMNQRVMAIDGAHRMSTFYGYYVLQARAKAGDYQGCLDCIRDYWGGMLDVGATTFWEDFNLDWLENSGRIDALAVPGKNDIHGDYGNYCYKGFRHSLCHGWASGPTAWLTEHVLGISIVEPGCKVIAIRPHLGDLQWAKGTFPTPYGIISVEHRKESDGKITTSFTAPEGIRIIHP